jgi:hypothetical protein
VTQDNMEMIGLHFPRLAVIRRKCIRSSPARCNAVGLKVAVYSLAMKLEFPIVPASKSTLDTRDLPPVPALARSADAKETAIVCLSAALLFASLAVLALATER